MRSKIGLLAFTLLLSGASGTAFAIQQENSHGGQDNVGAAQGNNSSPEMRQDRSHSGGAQSSSLAAEQFPVLPDTPALSETPYPDCREDFQKIDAPFDKAEDTNRCTTLLDKYYAEVLVPYQNQMIAHQSRVSEIYLAAGKERMKYSKSGWDNFYSRVMQEHADSNPDGAHMAQYRKIEAQYQEDRVYLKDRFCFNTGCGGYPMPAYVAKVEEPDTPESKGKKRSKKAKRSKKCKTARGAGGLLGGVLGAVGGKAAGLGKVGTLIASGLGGILVSEIACQLTSKEQKAAAEATLEVTKKEEVGATAEWKSPTRSGVAGSSTVTALNTEPNGNKCLNITDVAIVEGVETRVSKRMCRGQGDSGYSIMA